MSIDTMTSKLPEKFFKTQANELVRNRMLEIDENTVLKFKPGVTQAALRNGPKYPITTRVFRHKFTDPVPEMLVREDVLRLDPALQNAVIWELHEKNSAFQKVRTDDLQLISRIFDAIEKFAAH